MPILSFFANRFVVVLFVAILAGCAPAEDEAGSEASGAPSIEPVEIVAEVESGAITAESLTGTTWVIADYSVTFEAEGVVGFNSGSKGTWSLTDGTITIAAAGEETIISVEGDRLTHNGLTLERQ